jgi:D-aminopeptidase
MIFAKVECQWALAAMALAMFSAGAAAAASAGPAPTAGVAKARARDLGVPFDGTPGPLNAITDVAGVTVGHASVNEGADVHTGVTAVLPRGAASQKDPVFAGWFAQNGNGEMTGTTWVEESGFLEGPVMITNTHSVGVVRDAVIKWRLQRGSLDADGSAWALPIVAETAG